MTSLTQNQQNGQPGNRVTTVLTDYGTVHIIEGNGQATGVKPGHYLVQNGNLYAVLGDGRPYLVGG